MQITIKHHIEDADSLAPSAIAAVLHHVAHQFSIAGKGHTEGREAGSRTVFIPGIGTVSYQFDRTNKADREEKDHGFTTKELENLIELAELLGRELGASDTLRDRLGDSRDDRRKLTQWAREFEALHTGKDWDEQSVTYYEAIDQFFDQKLASVL